MRPKEDIEQSLRNSDLDIEINAETDRTILNRLVATYQTPQRAAGGRTAMRFALAAIVMIATVLVVHLAWHNGEPARVDVPKEPSLEMLNLASLNAAYRRGGLDAVDAQYQKVFSPEPKPQPLSVTTLLGELTNNGES